METIDENFVVLDWGDDDAIMTDRLAYVLLFIFNFVVFLHLDVFVLQ